MADDFTQDDKDNPFSFKKFVKSRNKSEGQHEKSNSTEVKSKNVDLHPETINEGQNPFSFKEFLKKKKTTTPPTTLKSNSLLLVSGSDSSFSSGNDSNDEETIKFPETTHRKSNPPIGVEQDLFTKDIDSMSSDDDDDDEPLHSKGLLVSESLNLKGMTDNVIDPFPCIGTGEDDSDLKSQIEKLKEENDNLKRKLLKYEVGLKKEKEKNKSLANDLKTLKKKEQSETKALEEMILKVEENLTAANKRSVTAEATIAKLRQEIGRLQAEIATSKNPQAIHQSYEDLILGVREKANYASQQLAAASQRADLQIRELCQGIETLKLVSEILFNIDNSFEVKK